MNRNSPSSRRVCLEYRFDAATASWHVGFREHNSQTMLPRRLVFHDPAKIIEMHIRWSEEKTSSAVHLLQQQLAKQRPGQFWLTLSEEQYQVLTLPKAPAAAATSRTSRAASA